MFEVSTEISEVYFFFTFLATDMIFYFKFF